MYIAADSNEWPKEWKTIYYKSYPRTPKISLSPRKKLPGEFSQLLRGRHSSRDFDGKPVKKETLSQLLLYSCGMAEGKRGYPARAHPSGGVRFPIEIYPLVFAGNKDIPAGVYHYNIQEHALDVLWQRKFEKKDIQNLFTYEWIQRAPVALVMTGVFWRNQIKYGERGYRYVLLEAGHISENVYLTAQALNMRCCAMGGMRDENIERVLDIDGITESVVHSLILG